MSRELHRVSHAHQGYIGTEQIPCAHGSDSVCGAHVELISRPQICFRVHKDASARAWRHLCAHAEMISRGGTCAEMIPRRGACAEMLPRASRWSHRRRSPEMRARFKCVPSFALGRGHLRRTWRTLRLLWQSRIWRWRRIFVMRRRKLGCTTPNLNFGSPDEQIYLCLLRKDIFVQIKLWIKLWQTSNQN